MRHPASPAPKTSITPVSGTQQNFPLNLADHFHQFATIEIGTKPDTKATARPWLFS
jgi:hypothetical protein